MASETDTEKLRRREIPVSLASGRVWRWVSDAEARDWKRTVEAQSSVLGGVQWRSRARGTAPAEEETTYPRVSGSEANYALCSWPGGTELLVNISLVLLQRPTSGDRVRGTLRLRRGRMPRLTFLRLLASVTLNMIDAASDILVAIGFLSTSLAFGVAAFSILGVHTLVSVAMALSSGRPTTAALQFFTLANGGILFEFYNTLRGYERTAVSMASHLPPVAGEVGVERLKFIESILESFPQLLLQFLALFTAGEGSVGPLLLFSLSMSLLSLAFVCANSDMSGFQEAVQARVVALIVMKEQRRMLRAGKSASATRAVGQALARGMEAARGAIPSPTRATADAGQPQSPQRQRKKKKRDSKARSALASVARTMRSAAGGRAASTAPTTRSEDEAEAEGDEEEGDEVGGAQSAAEALDPSALKEHVKKTVLWTRRALQMLTLLQRMLEMVSRAGFYIVIVVHGTWQIGLAWLFILGARYLTLYGRQLNICGFKEGQRAWIEGAGNYAVVKRLLAGVDTSSLFVGDGGNAVGAEEGGDQKPSAEEGVDTAGEAKRGEAGTSGQEEGAASHSDGPNAQTDGLGEDKELCDGASPSLQGAGEEGEAVAEGGEAKGAEEKGAEMVQGETPSAAAPGPDAADAEDGGGESGDVDLEAGGGVKQSAGASERGGAGTAGGNGKEADKGPASQGTGPAGYASTWIPAQLAAGRRMAFGFQAPAVFQQRQAPVHASAGSAQQPQQQPSQQPPPQQQPQPQQNQLQQPQPQPQPQPQQQPQQQQPQQQQRQQAFQRPGFFRMDPSALRANAAARVTGKASLFQGASELTEKELTARSAREHPSAGQLFVFGLPLLLISLLALPPSAKTVPDWIRRRSAPRDSVNIVLEACVVHVLFVWASALASGSIWRLLTVQALFLSWLHMGFWILVSVVINLRLYTLDNKVGRLRTRVRQEQDQRFAQ